MGGAKKPNKMRRLGIGILIVLLIAVYAFLLFGLKGCGGRELDCPLVIPDADRRLHEDPLTGLLFVALPGGCVQMGSPVDEKGRNPDEGPVVVRGVTPLFFGTTEVTRDAFAAFVAETGYVTDAERDGFSWVYTGTWERRAGFSWKNPGYAQSGKDPVVQVSLFDARAMARWMSRGKRRYRLPSEVEWEFAARAGTQTPRFWGVDMKAASGYANGADRTALEKFPAWTVMEGADGFIFTAPVGSFAANPFGLYDMLGNVWEWCDTRYETDAYGRQALRPAEGGRPVVIRGGSWYSRPEFLRSASRDHLATPDRRGQDIGFRLVMEIGD